MKQQETQYENKGAYLKSFAKAILYMLRTADMNDLSGSH